MSLSRSWGLVMVPEETEWDCSEPSVGLGGGSLLSVGGLLDLGFVLFLESALEASGPCDLGKRPWDCQGGFVLLAASGMGLRFLGCDRPWDCQGGFVLLAASGMGLRFLGCDVVLSWCREGGK
uniref:Uncharacterized protein n=1 Tax=Tanacetum cinerariifolium TaxID=118510 RepID=A0A6L2LRV4_TANCI|nr:hypothetical protein [Tanacetum cinerariifolium]